MPPITKTSECCGVVRGQRGHIKARKVLKNKQILTAFHLEPAPLIFFFFCWRWKCIDVLILKNGLPLMVLACHPGCCWDNILSYSNPTPSSSTYCSLWKCLSVRLIGTECASSALVLQLNNLSDTLNSCSLFIPHCPNCSVMFLSTGSGFCSSTTFGEMSFSAFLTLTSTVYACVQWDAKRKTFFFFCCS